MARNRGRGRGRGGRGCAGFEQDARQPAGQSSNGVVKNNREKKPGRGRGQGRGSHPSAKKQSSRQAKKSGAKSSFIAVQEEVKEEGLLRHQEIPKAHTDAVMAIAIAPEFIYTASRDKTLKRWKVGRSPSTGRFELQPELEVPLGEQCWCMLIVGDWLFCGLGSGRIKGFQQTGKDMLIEGHAKRCSSLIIHQNVLISGGHDCVVKLWQMNEAAQTLMCTHTITEGLPGATTCMYVLGEHLWVSGTSGLAVVELASLRVVHHIPPKKFVAGMMPFEGHMIVIYADGAACIYDAAGVQKHSQAPMPAGPVLCVGGLEVGPRLLCGHAKGQISAVALPMFELRKYWQAQERCKIQCMTCAPGRDGIFIVGAENGALQLWQKDPNSPP